MEKTKQIKLFLGLFYLILIVLLLYFFFSKFTIQEITSYEFIKNNRNYFYDLRQSNLFLLGTLFILFTIIWILALGFLSPLGLLAGFMFGKWFGLIFLISGTAIGATLLYLVANFFFKEIIRDKNRYHDLRKSFEIEIEFK